MNKTNDITGKKYGCLTVLEYHHTEPPHRLYWKCRCDCGKTVIECGRFIKSGFIVNCGCDSIPTIEESIKIRVGQQVKFDQFDAVTGFSIGLNRGNEVIGTVAYVNDRHKWFSVEYGYPKQRISFNYADIGKAAIICG